MRAITGESVRTWGITLLSVLLSLFVLYTCATGPFESIIQRAIFLAILICLGVLYYPLWGGTRMRPAGIVIDACMALVSIVACSYVIINYDMIMTTLPMATTLDIFMTAALSAVILEIARRAIGYIFPTIVVIILAYALFGEYVPGRMGHRGFHYGRNHWRRICQYNFCGGAAGMFVLPGCFHDH